MVRVSTLFIYFANMNMILFSAGRLRSGPRQVRADQDLLERGGDAVVPPARRPPRLHRVLDPDRHVGRRLHFLRDGLGQAALPRVHRRGRATLDIQGALTNTRSMVYKRRLIRDIVIFPKGLGDKD